MTSLVEEARLDAKAFRENTVYDSEGDPIRLIANADRLDQYADTIEALCEALDIALDTLRMEGACNSTCVSCNDARALIARAKS